MRAHRLAAGRKGGEGLMTVLVHMCVWALCVCVGGTGAQVGTPVFAARVLPCCARRPAEQEGSGPRRATQVRGWAGEHRADGYPRASGGCAADRSRRVPALEAHLQLLPALSRSHADISARQRAGLLRQNIQRRVCCCCGSRAHMHIHIRMYMIVHVH
jgi:hypothetical protein